MSKIIELSETLANQIAAGEVVERPSSVVKELVENALDANSSQIDIYLEEAGLRKIQIIDNGDGIENEDVLNAFKRHATSKIHNRDDLFRIKTLGFRGEALPSIASVSEMTIETSTGTEEGRFVKMSGGKVVEDKPHSLRKGTKVTVENLFFNTPARLKYVKTLQTELANIGDMVNRLALSHPEVAFRLIHDGNQMLTTSGNGDLKQTIAGIYGVATAKKMLEIGQGDLDFKVSGYVSLPEVTRASRNYISIIINGRYIKNYLLNKAIVEGYGSKLMIGRFPIAVIKIEMDPLLVDVNVHPTKQEVRLSKEKELMALISKGIREVLEDQQLIPKVDSNLAFKKELPKESKISQPSMFDQEQEKTKAPDKGTLAFDSSNKQFYIPRKNDKEWASDPILYNEPLSDNRTIALEKVNEPLFDDPFKSEFHDEQETEELVPIVDSNGSVGAFPELEYFGQMHGTYLFAQSEKGLYILDQHAAQERIKYEYFRKKIGEVGSDLQELLVPIVLDYPQSDSLKIKESMPELESVGIHLEEFGQSSYLCRAHPTWYPAGMEESIIREMIELVLETGKLDVAKFREDTAIMMSCKQSIKANHHLDEAQSRQLLIDLAKCENPYNCPHGRPVLVHFDNKDMEKMFKRIQDSH
ncbi:DNA mismatch repair endonuclease MutL [Vagococcus coleopterorum]|uniref:DNA mismatch repair protein MutL n=1 Tax=Vagococcus coleopterorum TaxID=2714946 RepID=A0A6G8ALM9_9ENTE|nr:DNA mismatch repair endonuclease MutL [Vagococcus coleopterorum]QIL45897.1 DNA mismatch repair endonuclease MutL [Vagococcus coleopterorum]